MSWDWVSSLLGQLGEALPLERDGGTEPTYPVLVEFHNRLLCVSYAGVFRQAG